MNTEETFALNYKLFFKIIVFPGSNRMRFLPDPQMVADDSQDSQAHLACLRLHLGDRHARRYRLGVYIYLWQLDLLNIHSPKEHGKETLGGSLADGSSLDKYGLCCQTVEE